MASFEQVEGHKNTDIQYNSFYSGEEEYFQVILTRSNRA